MRKIIITFLFLISSVFSFATINDNLNILKDEEKVEINEKVEEIKKEKDLTVFVNTLSMDVGFAVSDPERALILNIKKGDKETYKEKGSSTPIMIAAFVIIILFIVYKMYSAYKDKSNQEEEDDE